ncbi:hydrogen peroxide-dependent heme synthase [Leifsonia sp. Root112D2]|uniref:hydrogen peroxide-dependent heme synthase n=1 Tax=Leifsonia sp. Root112D2 TaxID=1736426 RepID=UPI0007009C46|nr:hydrogen peroxide-dependent heme synthase [Leifsonia sp. Root112D2]KQV08319.1 chlorite dismutase [Leifsonia sp. Root112D2]
MTNPAAAVAASPHHTAHPDEEPPQGFTLWAVFRRDPLRSSVTDAGGADELRAAVTQVEASGVTVRGIYDVSGFKADSDLMFWLHGPTAEGIQAALRVLRRTALISALLPTWNYMAVHRDAEFNKAHVPAFLRGVAPAAWITVYPFVRTHEWYLLPDEERSRMLADHGRKGAAFRSVLANTVAAFALGDYEWVLPLESDSLTDLVDLMRALRQTDARLYVKEETPFFTGRRISVADVPEVLS